VAERIDREPGRDSVGLQSSSASKHNQFDSSSIGLREGFQSPEQFDHLTLGTPEVEGWKEDQREAESTGV